MPIHTIARNKYVRKHVPSFNVPFNHSAAQQAIHILQDAANQPNIAERNRISQLIEAWRTYNMGVILSHSVALTSLNDYMRTNEPAPYAYALLPKNPAQTETIQWIHGERHISEENIGAEISADRVNKIAPKINKQIKTSRQEIKLLRKDILTRSSQSLYNVTTVKDYKRLEQQLFELLLVGEKKERHHSFQHHTSSIR